jgi:manganese/zinc/iron transport system permease protein
MGICASLVGVISVLRKRSLLGETLSHATYPGVTLAIVVIAIMSGKYPEEITLAVGVLVGASLTALLGLKAVDTLEQKWSVKDDAALCLVLASFFGLGTTVASLIQVKYSSLYNQIQGYLYGQPATMTDFHIRIYGLLTVVTILVISVFYKEIKLVSFDRAYAQTIGINTKLIDNLIVILIVLAIVAGIRSVGIVLMSAMLIAPAVAARQYTNNLYTMFILASLFGGGSGFLGNYIAVEFSIRHAHTQEIYSLPTGPLIVLVTSAICFISLCFSPSRGLIIKWYRSVTFRYTALQENILKAFWRQGPDKPLSLYEIATLNSTSRFSMGLILYHLQREGWITYNFAAKTYTLSLDGVLRASQIVRLHRLWEVYLVDYLGVGAERVHKSAEEMEHIITPALEKELNILLNNPRYDPHQQPIPPSKGLWQ